VVVQPTRGLDVAAVRAVRARLLAEKRRGSGVLLVSLELDERVIRRLALMAQATQRRFPLGEEEPSPPKLCRAFLEGFSPHANTRVHERHSSSSNRGAAIVVRRHGAALSRRSSILQWIFRCTAMGVVYAEKVIAYSPAPKLVLC
jgi:hypothetical protein